jgi:hypothetical protein
VAQPPFAFTVPEQQQVLLREHAAALLKPLPVPGDDSFPKPLHNSHGEMEVYSSSAKGTRRIRSQKQTKTRLVGLCGQNQVQACSNASHFGFPAKNSTFKRFFSEKNVGG